MVIRKHRKRHEKPYRCTCIKTCKKTFGSKNDWKRHENSQHYLTELWKCGISDSVGSCRKVYWKEHLFRTHLEEDHSLDQGTIEQEMEARHIGSGGQVAFWCGYCRDIIKLTKSGLEAKDERFNHIDEHFAGKSMARDDWVYVDEEINSPKKDKEQGQDWCQSTARTENSIVPREYEGQSGAVEDETESAETSASRDGPVSLKRNRESNDIGGIRSKARRLDRPHEQQQGLNMVSCVSNSRLVSKGLS